MRLVVGNDLIILTKEQYELLLSQRIDRPVSQIVSPLAHKRIDTLQFRRAKTDLVTVDANQRDYFDVVESTERRKE